ncbi:peptidoglycan recognition protein [Holotrichia oblita]|uniref:Peptidoglycan recognition protein n=1 Tax=Holotrichia oblita TaxID=644536 RepID=A0ACB9T1D6_HOLOL|nr:peptidoglycan recognition protein [Holotrichia oblita]
MKVNVIFIVIATEIAIVFGGCPTIISKNDWGGAEAVKIEYAIKPVKYVIIHHTSTPTCTTEADCSRRLVNMQSYHIDEQNFDDIGYNFIIGGDGQIYEGAGWHKVGAHTLKWNSKSVGIAFMGDYQSTTPTAKQLEAGQNLIQCGVDKGEIDRQYKLLGARSLRPTDSPGTMLFRKIQSWRGFTRTP